MKKKVTILLLMAFTGLSLFAQTWHTSKVADFVNNKAWSYNFDAAKDSWLNGDILFLWIPETALEYKFKGTKARILAITVDTTADFTNEPQNGTADIYVDGVLVADNFSFRGDTSVLKTWWTSEDLNDTIHTIRIVNNGDYIGLYATEIVGKEYIPATWIKANVESLGTDKAWSKDAGEGLDLGGNSLWMWVAGKGVDYKFIGTQVKIHAVVVDSMALDNNDGINGTGDIYIDNVLVADNFDFRNDFEKSDSLVWTSELLKDSMHTIRIETNGDYFGLNAIEFLGFKYVPANWIKANIENFNTDGGWSKDAGEGLDLGGNSLWMWVANKGVNYKFIGTQAKIYAVVVDSMGLDNNDGINGTGDIYIDNVLVADNFDFRNDAEVADSLVWTSAVLTDEMHTIRIVTNGDYFGLNTIEFNAPNYKPFAKIDDANTAWKWNLYADPDLTGAHVSNVAGASAQITFKGTYFEAYAETKIDAGDVEVFVDGVSKGVFTQKADPGATATLFVTISGLTDEIHIIKFVSVVDTKWTGIDYISILGELSGPTIPSKADGLELALNGNSIDVKWNATATATGYSVWRRIGVAGAWTEVKVITDGAVVAYNDIDVLPSKTYYYKIVARNEVGNGIFSEIVFIKTIATGINDNQIVNFSMYPNPATTGKVNITTDKPGKLNITDLSGKVVMSVVISNINNTTIDLTGVQNGIYIVKYLTAEGVAIEKLVIK